MHLSPYLRLMRLHQPVGAWLLLWPCWWAALLASRLEPPLITLGFFALGAIVMRGAGCIINDIADREIDAQVERTRDRPLASGELSLTQAAILLAILLLAGLWIAWQLGIPVLLLSCVALPLVAAYPFMKRLTWWPQLFLGVTFNWGALLGWTAMRGDVEWPAVTLYLACVCWTLGYDTIYAHQDKEDDARLGVKSTALRLGAGTKLWVAAFYADTVFWLLITGWLTGNGVVYYTGVALMGLHLAFQVARVDLDSPASCAAAFRSNALLGWILFLALWLEKLSV